MANSTQVGSMEFTKPSDTQLVATREIDAPIDLVWAAHTQCEHIQRWLLGPEGWTMPVCDIDLRQGGRYRHVYQGPEGASFQFSGEYREIQAPVRIVSSERFNDNPSETLNTLELQEKNGHTLIRTAVEYPSMEIREEAIATGMLEGWAESYDRLEKQLCATTGE